jgi:hypothetical protein
MAIDALNTTQTAIVAFATVDKPSSRYLRYRKAAQTIDYSKNFPPMMSWTEL